MKQLKRIKQQKKLSHASHSFYNRYAAFWNIKTSCKYHSADTQQKPTQRKNSTSFVSQARTWRIEPDEIQISYVTNLHPSIPVDKTIDVCLQQLSEDDFKTKTKLTLIDIQQLIKLCVNAVFFRTMLSGIYLIQNQLAFQ